MNPVPKQGTTVPVMGTHALAFYGLWRQGCRSNDRYLVFQVLPKTVGLSAGHWKVLAKAHERRNLAEYEDHPDRDDQLLADMITSIHVLLAALGLEDET